jgi:hypothetical protein
MNSTIDQKAQPGSVQRSVLLRLTREWRNEAKIFRRELGACSAAADRAQVAASYRKLEYCAAALERLAK